MTRKLFEIVIVLTGLILGSLATLHTSVVPTQVSYTTNQNVKVLFENSPAPLSELTKAGKSMLPLHEENGQFKFSPTLTVGDYNDDIPDENLFFNTQKVKISDNIDNCYLQAELELTGEDEMNKALRAMLMIGNDRYYLSLDNPSVLTNLLLSKTAQTIKFYIWYELDDPNCTIENINAAQGSDVDINLYGYVTE